MFARGRVRQPKWASALGLIVGTVFVFIGVGVITPRVGWFGAIWTLFALFITAANAYNLFSDRGISLYDVDVDVGSEGQPPPESFDSKLRKLAQLRDDGLITGEEFERKRAEILNEKW